MALAGAFISFFILVVILMYSAIVWRSLDQYFREEFKKHLEQDKNYKRLQKEKLDIVKDVDYIDERVDQIKFEDSLVVKKGGCKREKIPGDKYKNQEDIEEDLDYVDDNEVCPFVLPQDITNDNGR